MKLLTILSPIVGRYSYFRKFASFLKEKQLKTTIPYIESRALLCFHHNSHWEIPFKNRSKMKEVIQKRSNLTSMGAFLGIPLRHMASRGVTRYHAVSDKCRRLFRRAVSPT